jgi:hypothetical protein
MHYRSYAFSKNGSATIVKRSDNSLIYDADVLSAGNIGTIASLYP